MLIDYATDPKIWEILDRTIPMLKYLNTAHGGKENSSLEQIIELRTKIKSTNQNPITQDEKNLLYNTLRVHRLGIRLLELETTEIDKLIKLVMPNSMSFIFDEKDIYENA